jgi:hypothetical protein
MSRQCLIRFVCGMLAVLVAAEGAFAMRYSSSDSDIPAADTVLKHVRSEQVYCVLPAQRSEQPLSAVLKGRLPAVSHDQISDLRGYGLPCLHGRSYGRSLFTVSTTLLALDCMLTV